MSISLNIKQYRLDHHISQEYMAEKLCMCQPNYSRIEKNDTACIKRLSQLALILGTTPEILQNYHLVQNENGALEIANWVKALVAEKEETIQKQSQYIQFQDHYIKYVRIILKNLGVRESKLHAFVEEN